MRSGKVRRSQANLNDIEGFVTRLDERSLVVTADSGCYPVTKNVEAIGLREMASFLRKL